VINSPLISRQIESAQKKVEAANFGARRNVLQYDDVLNQQRQLIYKERDKVLDGIDIHPEIIEMIKENVFNLCNIYLDYTKPSYEWDLEQLNDVLNTKFLGAGVNMATHELIEDTDVKGAAQIIYDNLIKEYEKKREEFDNLGFPIKFSDFERDVLLRTVDKFWTDHIDTMNTLREEIGILSYGQKDPIVAYKNESFELFDKMISEIREYTASTLFRSKISIQVQPNIKRPAPAVNPITKGSTPRKNNSAHIGRNDLCPCGSGKKYKNCCGKDKE